MHVFLNITCYTYDRILDIILTSYKANIYKHILEA